MHLEVLEKIGLSPNEAKIYHSLLDLDESSVNTLSVRTKINRRNIYDAMERLIEKGLASEVFIKGQKLFKPIHPERLLNLLEEKQSFVKRALPDMIERFNQKEQKEQAFVYKGVSGYKNYLLDILKEKETYYSVGGKGMWFDPRLKFFMPNFNMERKKLNIHFKHIFDAEIEKKMTDPLNFEENEYRFLPKECCSNLSFEFFGDHLGVYTGRGEYGKLKEDPTIFVLKSKEITEGFKKLFDFMWKHCEKPKEN